MKRMKGYIATALLVAFCLALASCNKQNTAATYETETNESTESTIAQEPEIKPVEVTQLPVVSEEMRQEMPEINAKLREIMGTSFTPEFEQDMDTFMAILKKAYFDCRVNSEVLKYQKTVELACNTYEYLIEEIDERLQAVDTPECLTMRLKLLSCDASLVSIKGWIITDSMNLTYQEHAQAYSGINSGGNPYLTHEGLYDTDVIGYWEELESVIEEYSMLFYGVDILSQETVS